MLRAMAAAALGGYVLCGINTTRRGAGLLADIRRSDCQILLVDGEHRPLLDGLDLNGIQVLDVTGPRYADAVAAAPALVRPPRGQRLRHPDDDLHLRHQRRSQGRPVRARRWRSCAAPA